MRTSLGPGVQTSPRAANLKHPPSRIIHQFRRCRSQNIIETAHIRDLKPVQPLQTALETPCLSMRQLIHIPLLPPGKERCRPAGSGLGQKRQEPLHRSRRDPRTTSFGHGLAARVPWTRMPPPPAGIFVLTRGLKTRLRTWRPERVLRERSRTHPPVGHDRHGEQGRAICDQVSAVSCRRA